MREFLRYFEAFGLLAEVVQHEHRAVVGPSGAWSAARAILARKHAGERRAELDAHEAYAWMSTFSAPLLRPARTFSIRILD